MLEERITDSSVETKLLQKTPEIIIKTSDFQKEFHKISQLLTDDPASTYQVRYIFRWVFQMGWIKNTVCLSSCY